ncbi:MAG: hypothetical protein V1859_00800 [archaeon]
MKPTYALVVVSAFLLGIVSTLCFIEYAAHNSTGSGPVTTYVTYSLGERSSRSQEELSDTEKNSKILSLLGFANEEKSSPSDWVKENQIHVSDERIIIDIKDAEWASFTDTNSMDPLIDEGANAIEIIPSSPGEIKVGDIVSYKSDYADGTIIHRIINIGFDDKGWYATMKGDNNPREDPGKVRFSQIKRVLVAIIY